MSRDVRREDDLVWKRDRGEGEIWESVEGTAAERLFVPVVDSAEGEIAQPDVDPGDVDLSEIQRWGQRASRLGVFCSDRSPENWTRYEGEVRRLDYHDCHLR